MSHRDAASHVIALYQAHVAAFARRRSRGLIERDWLAAFLQALPPGGRNILDLGCGTGEPMARHLIGRGCRLTGVDGASAMIARAQARFPDQRWITADMRALPALGRFHGLIAWHSLFHLTPHDQPPIFATFRRLAHPGAVLMFTTGPAQGETIGAFEGQPLYHASLDSRAYRALLSANGFEVLRHVVEDAGCGGATVWLARQGSGTLP